LGQVSRDRLGKAGAGDFLSTIILQAIEIKLKIIIDLKPAEAKKP
jgi:hypothetical protein